MGDGAKLGLLGVWMALFAVIATRKIQQPNKSLVGSTEEINGVFGAAATDIGICWTNCILYLPRTCSHSSMKLQPPLQVHICEVLKKFSSSLSLALVRVLKSSIQNCA